MDFHLGRPGLEPGKRELYLKFTVPYWTPVEETSVEVSGKIIFCVAEQDTFNNFIHGGETIDKLYKDTVAEVMAEFGNDGIPAAQFVAERYGDFMQRMLIALDQKRAFSGIEFTGMQVNFKLMQVNRTAEAVPVVKGGD